MHFNNTSGRPSDWRSGCASVTAMAVAADFHRAFPAWPIFVISGSDAGYYDYITFLSVCQEKNHFLPLRTVFVSPAAATYIFIVASSVSFKARRIFFGKT